MADSKESVTRLAERWGWSIITDIEEDGLTQWMAEELSKGLSNRYLQKHGRACKQFTKWLAGADKLPRDPFRRDTLPSPEAGRKLRRRMLLPAEWLVIVDYLGSPKANERYGMSPEERTLLYDLAIQTGLRNTELRTIKAIDLVVGNDLAYVTKTADQTKNESAAKQYIRLPLAKALRSRNISPQAPLLPMPRREDCAKMLCSDLDQARLMWIDKGNEETSSFLRITNDKGERLDFHALRHTCGAWMAIAGVSPKLIQKVMRHSTITLTLDTYGHLLPDTEKDAVEMQSRVFSVAKMGPLFVPSAS